VVLLASTGFAPGVQAGPITSVNGKYTTSTPSSGTNISNFQVHPGTGTASLSGAKGPVASGLAEGDPITIDFRNPPTGSDASVTNLTIYGDPNLQTRVVFAFNKMVMVNSNTVNGSVTLVSNTTSFDFTPFQNATGMASFTFNPPTGSGVNIHNGIIGGGDPFFIDYDPGLRLNIDLIAVPEPGAFALGVSGLLGLAGLGWMRRRMGR
jgi:hypothetical protein